MSRRKIILALIVLFSTGAFMGQSMSQTSEEQQPEYENDFEQDQQITSEENKKQMQDWSTEQMAEFERNRRRFERFRGLRPEQRIREMQKIAQEQETEAMKQALDVNEAQWKIIEPKLNKVKAYQEQATVSIGLPFSSSFISSTGSPQGGGFGGGFQYQFGGSGNIMTSGPSLINQTNQRQTQGEKICRELLVLIEDFNATPEAIRQKMLELQRARAKAKKQLAQAQKELREVLAFRQQARLVLIGLLD